MTELAHPSSAQILRQLKAEDRPVFLAFSRGKDSLATWLALREAEIEVVPVHMYLVPGLRFVEESFAFYKDWFGMDEVVNIPHPSFYRWLNNFVFTPPERCAIIEAANLPLVDYDDINTMLRADFKLPDVHRPGVAERVEVGPDEVRHHLAVVAA